MSSPHLGTPKLPTLATLQSLVLSLRQKLIKMASQPLKSIEELIDYHNTLTLYTGVFMGVATGVRAVSAPVLPSRNDWLMLWGNPLPDIFVLSDKDTLDAYHTRLILLVDSWREHLSFYFLYLDLLLSHCSETTISTAELRQMGAGTLFFLIFQKGEIVAEEWTVKGYESELQRLKFYFAGNAHRHYLRTSWLERGGPPDAIELFLGHWGPGEEGFTASSGLHPVDYFQCLNQHLLAILQEVGLTPQTKLPVLELSWAVASVRRANKRKPNARIPWACDVLPGPFWTQVAGCLDPKQDPSEWSLTQAQKDVLALVERKFPDLYQCRSQISTTQQEMEDFYYQILPRGVDRYAAYKRQFYFYRVLELGRKSDHGQTPWGLELPRKPIYIRREKNLLHRQMNQDLHLFWQIEQAFVTNLEAGLPKTGKTRIGQILLSGLLYGGLLSRTWFQRFPAALVNGVSQCGRWMWLDLWQGDVPADSFLRFQAQRYPSRYRRWVVDPTTQMLIYRFLDFKQTHSVRKCNAEDALQAYLEEIGFKGDKAIPTYRLRRCASSRALTCLPPFLVAYAGGRLRSASLPDERFRHMLTGKMYPIKRPVNLALMSHPRAMKTKSFLRLRQEQLRLELGRIFSQPEDGAKSKPGDVRTSKKKDQKTERRQDPETKVKNFLQRHAEELSPVLYFLGMFCLFLLSKKSWVPSSYHKKDTLAIGTVAGYLSVLGPSLLHVFRHLNPLDLESDELARYFGLLVDQYNKQTDPQIQEPEALEIREGVLAKLNYFMYFMELYYGLAPCEFSPLIVDEKDDPRGRISFAAGVSANFLSEAEYQRVLKALGWDRRDQSRLERMQACVMILGYRLGLRRSEILGLRFKDVPGQTQRDLLIRRHKLRRLKSINAYRRLMPELLMTTREWDYLKDWITGRHREAKVKPRDFLLTRNADDGAMLQDEDIMVELRQVIKHVTGNDLAVFHHARHSFYSSLVTNLMLRDDIEAGALPSFASGLKMLSPDLRSLIEGNLVTGRGKLHVLSILMGHADVATGMGSYFHLADWLWSYFSCHPMAKPRFTLKAWATVMGKQPRAAAELMATKDFPYTDLLKTHSRQLARRLDPQPRGKRGRIPGPPLKISSWAVSAFETVYAEHRQKVEAGEESLKLPQREPDRTRLRSMFTRTIQHPRPFIKRQVRFGEKFVASGAANAVEVTFRRFKELREFILFAEGCGFDKGEDFVYLFNGPWRDDAGRRDWLCDRWRDKFPDLEIKDDHSRTTKFKWGKLRACSSGASPLRLIPALVALLKLFLINSSHSKTANSHPPHGVLLPED